jgi:hypothetical protein
MENIMADETEKEKLATEFIKHNSKFAGRAPKWAHDLLDWLWPSK